MIYYDETLMVPSNLFIYNICFKCVVVVSRVVRGSCRASEPTLKIVLKQWFPPMLRGRVNCHVLLLVFACVNVMWAKMGSCVFNYRVIRKPGAFEPQRLGKRWGHSHVQSSLIGLRQPHTHFADSVSRSSLVRAQRATIFRVADGRLTMGGKRKSGASDKGVQKSAKRADGPGVDDDITHGAKLVDWFLPLNQVLCPLLLFSAGRSYCTAYNIANKIPSDLSIA